MNPLTNIRNVQKLNERELELGVIGKKSWHDEYKDSAWLFIGGLPYDLSEGDIICVFSQYGEVVNFNLVRDHKSGKSKGFAFLCYEDQRSTVLSVDNLNGIKILGRTIRVDHVKEYKVPKDHKNDDELVLKMREEGCAPKIQESSEGEEEEEVMEKAKQMKKEKKKSKKEKKKKKKKKASSSDNSESESEHGESKAQVLEDIEIKRERHDAGYDMALNNSRVQYDRNYPALDGRGDRQMKNEDRRRFPGKDFPSSSSRDRRRSPHSPSGDEDDSPQRKGYNGKSEKERRRDGDRREQHSRFDRDRENDGHQDRQRGRDTDRSRERFPDRQREKQKSEDSDRDRGRREDDRDRHGSSSRGRDKGRDDDREYDRGRDRGRDDDRDYDGGRDRSHDRNRRR
ncbi:RNA-binding motif protein, X-linked 2 [Aplysia californica]|uniref:RNA-binding motif protein, X-linked 2 n=1 Tax=Aplysia californica TaxID=6500 RepID=A0ABM0K6C6_APLCA|nr:RNA-binding motif protein, X-linked 2 [Aplysia californica]